MNVQKQELDQKKDQKLELKDCIKCKSEKNAVHEVWSPDGTYYGDICTNCYDTVHTELELYWYYGGPVPDWMIDKDVSE